jgi:SAM-dependent methyltransferase
MNEGFKGEYFKELADLEAGNFWFRSRNRLILWALGKYVPRMCSFLEIGCGTGFVISGIASRFPGTRLLGSEFLDEGLVFARQRVPEAEFLQMDARYIPYRAELDAIGAFDVLEHISEDDVVLQQIFNALKPGGHVIITVPQHRWLWSDVDDYACHVRRYDATELHEKVVQAGFRIIRSTSFVTMLLPAMYLSRLFNRGNTEKDTGDVAGHVAGLRVNPVLNAVLELLMAAEALLIRAGVSLPAGGSRLLVARKPTTPKDMPKDMTDD